MKARIALLTVAAFLLLTGSAEAFKWHMSYGQAKHSTREFSELFCREDPECVGWGVGPCQRRSDSRFDCVMASFYRNFYEPGDEVECDIMLHWGVNRSGYIRLKNYGSPNCRRVY